MVEQPSAGVPVPRAHAHVASRTPGRLRVRLQHPERHRQLLNTIQRRMEEERGTDRVRVDHRTGSVLVQYDPQTQTHTGILAILHDLGVLATETARGLGEDIEPIDTSGPSHASEGIVAALADLDRQLAILTGHKVDLKLIFPLALGGVGVWAVARRGLGLTEVPAYVLLWYAFDSFWKFHREPAKSSLDGLRRGP